MSSNLFKPGIDDELLLGALDESLSGDSDIDSGSDLDFFDNNDLGDSEPAPNQNVGLQNDVDGWNKIEDTHADDYAHLFSFNELPGPKHTGNAQTPIDFFNLFFPATLIQLIVVETNRYASKFMALNKERLSKHSRANYWQPTNSNEIRAFLACIINMGLVRKSTIFSYWSLEDNLATPWFNRMFSRNRFQLILKFLHLIDSNSVASSGQPGYDPCSKFEPFMSHANHVFRHYFTPHQQLSIDESLIGTKNHTQLMQYLPNKHHHRWGIKLWMLCDSVTKYCMSFYVYRGAKSDVDKEEIKKYGLAHSVVMKLLNICNFFNKGYHIFADNFFLSVPLAKHLYDLQTFITGTVRKNRKFLPFSLTKTKFSVGEKQFYRDGPLLAAGFRDKKSQKSQVVLLSTCHDAKETRDEVKLKVVQDYNKYMGGIDASDMMLYFYLDERRTVKYWKKVVLNIIGRMVLNSYILYSQATKNNITRLSYTNKIVQSLATEWNEFRRRPSQPRPSTSSGRQGNGSPPAAVGFGLTKLEGRHEKECCVCSKRGQRRRSRTACTKCNKGLHSHCSKLHRC